MSELQATGEQAQGREQTQAEEGAAPRMLDAAGGLGAGVMQRKLAARRLQRKAEGGQTEAGAQAEKGAEGAGAEEEREGESKKPKVAHTSPADADKLIQEAIGKIVPTLKTGKVAEGVICVVDDAAFRVAFERKYGDLDRVDAVNAFVERDHPDGGDRVWIHEKRGNAGTAIHEAMHLYSNSAFRDQLKKNCNEGATEYFTRLITDAKKIKRSNYNDELGAIQALVAASSQKCLADAYFSGNIEGLRAGVGAAKFDKFVEKMKADDYEEAKKALK